MSDYASERSCCYCKLDVEQLICLYYQMHELETQLTLVATRRKARVENGVDDGLKQRLSLLEQKTEAIAHPRWSRSTIPYTKMIALIQLFKAA